MVADEAVPGLRAHRRAVAADYWNRSYRCKRVEIEDRQALFEGGHRRTRIRRGPRLRRAARDVQPPVGRVREDVVRPALAADLRGLKDLVRPVGPDLAGAARDGEQRERDNRDN